MNKWLLILRMIGSANARHPWRTCMALFGIAVSVSLVTWNLHGFQVLGERINRAARQQGRFDIVISPSAYRDQQLDPVLVEAIQADPAVAEVDAAVKTRVRMLRPKLPPRRGPFGGISALGTDAKKPPQKLKAGRWLSDRAGEAVVSAGLARRAKLKLGDRLVVAGTGGDAALQVVGIIPGAQRIDGVRMMPPAHLADVFMTQAAAAKMNGYADRPSLLGLVLKDSDDAEAFADTWRSQLAAAKPAARLQLLKVDIANPRGGPPGGMQQMLFANASILAFVAAMLIVFVTLSTNVRERLREYAIFQALGLWRVHLIGMIVVEAILFAVGGWLSGWILLECFLLIARNLSGVIPWLPSGMQTAMSLGWPVIGVGLIESLIGALAATVLPCWQVWRIRPVEMLGGRNEPACNGLPWSMVMAGVLLIVLNPILIVMAREHAGLRSALAHFYGWGPRGFGAPLAGSLAMILGFILVVPLGVYLAEGLFGPIVAWLLRLDRRFLRQQLTGQLWRTTGTTIALSVGLTLFVTSLVWGYSMLVPFTPDQGWPRFQIAIMPAGVSDEAVAQVRQAEGIGQCMPVAVEQPRLTERMLQSKPFANISEHQQHVLVMGVDPEQAFGGDDAMFDLKFIAGDRKEIVRRLGEGYGCIVPDHFATQTGLKVGDKFSVDVPNRPGKQIEYAIVGIASMPGWNWLTKFSETRRRAGRALALVFVDYAQARSDFALDRVNYFWANPKPGVTGKQIQQALEPLANAGAGVTVNLPKIGRTRVDRQYVKITDREDVSSALHRRANSVIQALAWFPLITLLICGLAVFNALAASIRARFWQFGVLRGIGLSGGQLLRLVLAESLMICGVSCLLSLIAGVSLAWCGTRLCTLFFFFGGHTPPLVLPWASLGIGFGLTFVICLLAGALSAWRASRREPLFYIQAGRLAY